MSLEAYLIYLGVLVAFFATPPDTSQLLIMSNSMRHGLRRSLATVAGDLSANCLQMIAAALGLTAIIAVSADTIWWIKWLGVGYLGWIALRLMFSRGDRAFQSASQHGTFRTLFRQGFFTSLANPYAVVFFGALFPQFVDPTLPIVPQLLTLGFSYLALDAVTLVAWGWMAQRTVARIRQLQGVWLNRISGGLMLAAAALLASRDLTAEIQR